MYIHILYFIDDCKVVSPLMLNLLLSWNCTATNLQIIMLDLVVDLCDNYGNLSDLYVDLLNNNVNMLDFYFDLSYIVMTSKWPLVALTRSDNKLLSFYSIWLFFDKSKILKLSDKSTKLYDKWWQIYAIIHCIAILQSTTNTKPGLIQNVPNDCTYNLSFWSVTDV